MTGRVAKLVLAGGTRTAPESDVAVRRGRYCATPAVRAWNGDACDALDAARCSDGTCSYEHFGNCSGFLVGGGWLVTAAHCLAPLVRDPALMARSTILIGAGDGAPQRRLPMGRIVLGKQDFDHDLVAIDDADPIDAGAVAVEDDGLDAWPMAPVPPRGVSVFIVGFPRVERRPPASREAHGYDLTFGVLSVSFGRVADRNEADRPLCSVDGLQEHWALSSDCPTGPVQTPDGPTWRGVLTRSPFLATYDSCNGYSGGPVFDEAGRLIGVNATLISDHDLQDGYDDTVRMVATPIGRVLERLGIR